MTPITGNSIAARQIALTFTFFKTRSFTGLGPIVDTV